MARTQIFGDSQIEDNTVIDADVATTAAIQLSKLGSGNLTLLNQGSIIFKELTASGTDSVTIEAPNDVTTSYTLKLPLAQASGTQVLSNDGSGNLSWSSAGSGSGTVNSGTAGRLSLYATSTTAVSDTYVQNTKNITLAIAAQGSRSQNLALTIPNPGDAVTVANVVLDQGAYTIAGVITLSSALTVTPTTNQLVLGTTRTVTLNVPTPATASRIYTIPDQGADANIVGDKASYTLSGAITINSLTLGGDASAGSHKITNLSNGTATADAIAFGQVNTLFMYRRPVLTFSTVSTVTIETGLDGNSGEAKILFPDGEVRVDSTAGDIVFDITRNAAFASGTIQSGLASGSEATNTWYAIYAVKVTKVGDTGRFVLVGSTTLPLQANYTTLNTNFGGNGWIYLGLIRNGDGAGATGDILNFVQAGHITAFRNGTTNSEPGIAFASTAGAATLVYTYSAGTGATNIPNNISLVKWLVDTGAVAASVNMWDSTTNHIFSYTAGTYAARTPVGWIPAADGIQGRNNIATSIAYAIQLTGFVDGVLGVGSNPFL
jgi:hypothetical protein